ncbi:MAG: hypothetical protein RL653_3819 [Pseudomonadota bacterium]|jgi:hypothetical protein
MPNRISGSTGPVLPVRTGDLSAPASSGDVRTPAAGLPTVHDAFEPAASAPWAPKVRTALDVLDGRVRTALHHDALSLARGLQPVREGDPLTPAQQDALEDAAKDFFLELPLGALNPAVAEAIAEQLRGADLGGRDPHALSLKDLGRVGRDLAKAWARELREEKPAAYYGLMVATYAGVGYAYGSEGLERLGIKPEFKVKIFGDKLALKVRGQWEEQFRDATFTGALSSRFDLGNGSSISGEARLGSSGVTGGTVRYDYGRPDLNLSANADFDSRGVSSVGGTVNWRRDDLSLSAGARYDLREDRLSANAEATWKVRENVDFALSASHDNRGETRIGAGLRIIF